VFVSQLVSMQVLRLNVPAYLCVQPDDFITWVHVELNTAQLAKNWFEVSAYAAQVLNVFGQQMDDF